MYAFYFTDLLFGLHLWQPKHHFILKPPGCFVIHGATQSLSTWTLNIWLLLDLVLDLSKSVNSMKHHHPYHLSKHVFWSVFCFSFLICFSYFSVWLCVLIMCTVMLFPVLGLWLMGFLSEISSPSKGVWAFHCYYATIFLLTSVSSITW